MPPDRPPRRRGPPSLPPGPGPGPRVRKKHLNGFSLQPLDSVQREAHLGIEVGLARPVLSGVFRAFCPPPQGKPFTAVFFFLAAAVPAGTAQGFLSPGPGQSFFQVQTRQIRGSGPESGRGERRPLERRPLEGRPPERRPLGNGNGNDSRPPRALSSAKLADSLHRGDSLDGGGQSPQRG